MLPSDIFRDPPGRSFVLLWLMAVLALRLTPTALGLQPLPGSLTSGQALFSRGSIVVMILGCLATALGIIWPRRSTGLGLEMAGYIVIGWASLFYGIALAVFTPASSSAWASGLTLGLSAGCFAQTVVIWVYVRERRKGQSASGLGESPRGGT